MKVRETAEWCVLNHPQRAGNTQDYEGERNSGMVCSKPSTKSRKHAGL